MTTAVQAARPAFPISRSYQDDSSRRGLPNSGASPGDTPVALNAAGSVIDGKTLRSMAQSKPLARRGREVLFSWISSPVKAFDRQRWVAAASRPASKLAQVAIVARRPDRRCDVVEPSAPFDRERGCAVALPHHRHAQSTIRQRCQSAYLRCDSDGVIASASNGAFRRLRVDDEIGKALRSLLSPLPKAWNGGPISSSRLGYGQNLSETGRISLSARCGVGRGDDMSHRCSVK